MIILNPWHLKLIRWHRITSIIFPHAYKLHPTTYLHEWQFLYMSWFMVAELTLCDWKWPLPPINTYLEFYNIQWGFQWVTEENLYRSPTTTQEVSYKVRFVMVECDRVLGSARQLVSAARPVCIYVCVWVHSLRVSTVMISSLHRRWQVWLSVSRPELKRRHSMHSLKRSSAT